MSSSERAARALKSLKDEEWKTLSGLERAAKGQGTADVGRLSREGRLPVERVRFALERLVGSGMVTRKGLSYSLRTQGVEALALREYVRKDLISALGAVIAKGKESDVYEAFDDEGDLFALKFYKLGRTSFTSVRKKRSLDSSDMRSWITANYQAAQREFGALRRLEGLSRSFPRAFAYNRSTLLLEELSGFRLSERPELEAPGSTLAEILGCVRKAYMRAHIVNADLSEYNVLTDGSRVWVIDWPQAVEASHPNAGELLRHDVFTLLTFFRRAYGVEVGEAGAMAYVTGTASALEED